MYDETIIAHTADVVAAYVANNALPVAELPGLITLTYRVLRDQGAPIVEDPPRREPAVPIAKSVHRDYVVCLEDGKRFKSLKRHLRSLGLTPAEYRARWGLPDSHPIVCASYSERRSELAKKIGLGRRNGSAA